MPRCPNKALLAEIKITAIGGKFAPENGKFAAIRLSSQLYAASENLTEAMLKPINSEPLDDEVEFCVDKENIPTSVSVQFFAADGSLLCERLLDLEIVSYCNPGLYHFEVTKSYVENGECCNEVTVYGRDGACEIRWLKAGDTEVGQYPYLMAGGGTFATVQHCVPPSQNATTIPVTLKDVFGKTVCKTDLPIATCEDCCSNINTPKIVAVASTSGCGNALHYKVMVSQKNDNYCIYGVKVSMISGPQQVANTMTQSINWGILVDFGSGTEVADFCWASNAVSYGCIILKVEFLDRSGNVLENCTHTIKSCVGVPPGGGGGGTNSRSAGSAVENGSLAKNESRETLNGIEIFPNPNEDGKLRLSYSIDATEDEFIKIELLDINGKLIDVIKNAYDSNDTHHLEYNTEQLAPNLYFIRYTNGKN